MKQIAYAAFKRDVRLNDSSPVAFIHEKIMADGQRVTR